jgi:hypothetical protein
MEKPRWLPIRTMRPNGGRNLKNLARKAFGIPPEPKRQFAYRWLGAGAQKRLRREERSFLYLKLTLAAAILGVIVGIIGIVVTAMHVD